MRKIEFPPEWQAELSEVLRVRYQSHDDFKQHLPLLRSINDKYLYWDKIKYLNPPGIKPETFWALIKLDRLDQAKTVTFGEDTFRYNLTDVIQKGLHDFDLNTGGQLGMKSLIPGEEKGVYLVSSIMEEAIASSQIEGAVTTRKKA